MRSIAGGNNFIENLFFWNRNVSFRSVPEETAGNPAVSGCGCPGAALLTLTLALLSPDSGTSLVSCDWFEIVVAKVSALYPTPCLLFSWPESPVTHLLWERPLRTNKPRRTKWLVSVLVLCPGGRVWEGELWCGSQRGSPCGRPQAFPGGVETKSAWQGEKRTVGFGWEVRLCMLCSYTWWACANGAVKEVVLLLCFCLLESMSMRHMLCRGRSSN